MNRRQPRAWLKKAAPAMRRFGLPTYQALDQRMGNAQLVRRVMNLWPPFLFASIRVEEVAADFRKITVRLRHRALTSNYVGTVYGASMYSMTDPFWMMMLQRTLGPQYVVWDTRGEIDHLRPGRHDLTAEFQLTDEVLGEVKAATASGAGHRRWFRVNLVQEDGTIVAQVRKEIYVRRRKATP